MAGRRVIAMRRIASIAPSSMERQRWRASQNGWCWSRTVLLEFQQAEPKCCHRALPTAGTSVRNSASACSSRECSATGSRSARKIRSVVRIPMANATAVAAPHGRMSRTHCCPDRPPVKSGVPRWNCIRHSLRTTVCRLRSEFALFECLRFSSTDLSHRTNAYVRYVYVHARNPVQGDILGTVSRARTQLDGTGNRLLGSLSVRAYSRLEHHLRFISLNQGAVLYEPGASVDVLHFPISGIVSAVLVTGGKEAEVAMVGREGFLGVGAYLGQRKSTIRTIVQHPGAAYAIPVDAAMLGGSSPELRPLLAALNRYVWTYTSMVEQVAACRAMHTLDQQLARWLLMCQDRIDGSTLRLTHDGLARMLAVRRATVTKAARSLQSVGAIDYSHGRIEIVDRRKLEELVCDCYPALCSHLRDNEAKAAGAAPR